MFFYHRTIDSVIWPGFISYFGDYSDTLTITSDRTEFWWIFLQTRMAKMYMYMSKRIATV